MGFGLILTGFILMFNPVIHIVDLLPDVIGFLLIIIGLSKMSLLASQLAKARESFVKLAYLELAKTLLILFLPSMDGTMRLLWAFIFGVCEILVFVSAVGALFEGLSFTGLWFNGTAVFAKKRKKSLRVTLNPKRKATIGFVESEKDVLTATKNFTIFFFVYRNVMTILPELCELELYEYVGTVSSYDRSLASFKPLFYILEFILVFALGIAYIRKVVLFWLSVAKDTDYNESLMNKYAEDVATRTTFFAARKMQIVFGLVGISALFSLPIRSDGVSLFVGIISAGFLIAAAILVSSFRKSMRIVIPIAVVRGVLSVVNLFNQVKYFAEYNELDVLHFEKLYVPYYTMATTILVEYVLMAVAYVLFFVLILRVVRENIGQFGISHESVQYSKKRRDEEKFRQVKHRTVAAVIFTLIAFGVAAAYPFMKVYYDIFSLVEIIAVIVWVIYMVVFTDHVKRNIYDDEANIWG